MAEPLTGGCMCGRVRYAADTQARSGYWCHCRMCQRASGNVAISFLNVGKAEVGWQGEPDRFASSPIAERMFCARCGTQIGFAYPDSDRMDLTVGSLDFPETIGCDGHFGIESRHEGWWRTGLPEGRAESHAPLAERWRKAGVYSGPLR